MEAAMLIAAYLQAYLNKKVYFVFTTLFLILSLAPAAALGALQAEWQYDTAVTDLAGFRLYMNGSQVCYTPDPASRAINCDVVLPEGTHSFSMTAYTASGLESPHSDIYVVETASPPPAGNEAPVAYNESKTVNEGTLLSSTMSATDANGDALTFEVISHGDHFDEFSWMPDGSYSYKVNAPGSFAFSFRVSDGQALSNDALVAITVTDVNYPPEAIPDTAATSANTSTSIAVLANDTDSDGDTLSITSATRPQNGIAEINGSKIIYTPASNHTGTDSFSYTISDGQGGTATAPVSITVTDVNSPPIAADSSLGHVNGQATTLRLRAMDPDGDPLTFILTGSASKGTLELDSLTGEATYLAYSGATGTDSFTFRASDGSASSNQASVTLTIVDPKDVVTARFGSAANSSYPDTITETFTDLNDVPQEGKTTVSIKSWSNTQPHTPANTIILQADLTAIPADAVVTAAQLHLYQLQSTGDAFYESSAHRIETIRPVIKEVTGFDASALDAWSPVFPGITWDNIPLGLADVGRAEAFAGLDKKEGYKTWDVSAMVHEWVADPASNNGLLITGGGTGKETARVFAASEYADPAMRPVLVVSYAATSASNNIAPVAEFSAVQTDTEGNTWHFDASASSDVDGNIISYAWDLDDGTTAAGKEITHTYDAVGDYTIVLTVTDDKGATARAQVTINVTADHDLYRVLPNGRIMPNNK